MEKLNRKRPACVRACSTCPFRIDNHGKPNPEKADEVLTFIDPEERTQWYSRANLLRIWKGAQTEARVLTCHSTDDQAPAVGKEDRGGELSMCTGLLFVVRLHLAAYEQILDEHPELSRKPNATMRLYRERAGKYALSRESLFEYAMMFSMGRVSLFGGAVLPESMDERDLHNLGVQWDDPIVQAFRSEANNG